MRSNPEEAKEPMKLLSVAALLLAAPAFAQAVQVDAKIPEYKPVQGVSGSIKSVGSNTLNGVMALWADSFKKAYPAVTVEVEGKGSGTAPPALINGSATFGPMSREMKQKEIDDFEKAFGYAPTAVPVAVDTLAVFVHKDNPLKSLTLQQVDAIFSKTRNAKGERDLVTWGDLGLTGEWADKPISLYGRDSASGTNGFFKEHVLLNGDYKSTVKELSGAAGVVQGVGSDRFAIGYSGIGAKTPDVRPLSIAKDAKSDAVEASADTAYSGKYPMTRLLYVYVNAKPQTQLDPLRREFLRYVLSRQGQQDVIKDGFYPLTANLVDRALAKVGIAGGTVEAGAPAKR
jgi:phosphate transport system substrate-binding protein